MAFDGRRGYGEAPRSGACVPDGRDRRPARNRTMPPAPNDPAKRPPVPGPRPVAAPLRPATPAPAVPRVPVEIAGSEESVPLFKNFETQDSVALEEIQRSLRGSGSNFDRELPNSVRNILNRREERHTCSLPGLLRILFPERSFVPVALPARVIDFSAGGAMVDVPDGLKKLGTNEGLNSRFFELKIAHKELPDLRGVLAWSETEGTGIRLGLRFHAQCPQLVQMLDPTGTASQSAAPLPMPVLDPFPPTSLDRKIRLTGEAREALEVVIGRTTASREEVTVPVRGGRFMAEVELTENGGNFFMLRSRAGLRTSKRLPFEITYISPTSTDAFHFEIESAKDPASGLPLVAVEFSAPTNDAERLFLHVHQLMSMSERISLTARLAFRYAPDSDLIASIREEGRATASSWVTRQEARKILDELL